MVAATLSSSFRFNLLESSPAAAAGRVDRDLGIIRGVKVLGFKSRATGITIGCDPAEYGPAVFENYEYSRDAVARAAPLYEGIRVYIDHPEFAYKQDGERIPSQRDRKLSEVFGRLVNVRLTDTGLFADLEYVKTHPLAPQILELAEKYPELLALSHNAKGDPQLINGRIVITHIDNVRSVDLVGERPGTTHSLFESEPTMATLKTEPAMLPDGQETLVSASKLGTTLHEADPSAMAPDPSVMSEDAPDGDAPPAAGGDGGSADPFGSAFESEVVKIWNGEGSPQDKARKVAQLAKHKEGIDEIRGGGDGGGSDVDAGADLDESDPEPEPAKSPETVESAPCDSKDGKKPMMESEPKVIIKEVIKEVVPNKGKILRELLETVVIPSVNVLNAHSVPVTGDRLAAMCVTRSKRRVALAESFADASLPKVVRAAPRSTAGRVGTASTAPAAVVAATADKKEDKKTKPLCESSPDELWDMVNKTSVNLLY